MFKGEYVWGYRKVVSSKLISAGLPERGVNEIIHTSSAEAASAAVVSFDSIPAGAEVRIYE